MYAPDFTIPLPDGSNIFMLFNSWTYRTYCDRIGIEYEDLLQQVGEGKAFRAKHLNELFLTAAESHARFNKRDFTATEIDSFIWLDAMGGYNSSQLIGLYKVFVAKLLNVSPEQFDVLWNKATTEGEDGAKEGPKKSKPDMAPVLPIGSEGGVKAMGS